MQPISNFDPFEKKKREKLKSDNVFTTETSYKNE